MRLPDLSQSVVMETEKAHNLLLGVRFPSLQPYILARLPDVEGVSNSVHHKCALFVYCRKIISETVEKLSVKLSKNYQWIFLYVKFCKRRNRCLAKSNNGRIKLPKTTPAQAKQTKQAKKAAKISVPSQIKVEGSYTCSCCGYTLAEKNFYKSNSPVWGARNKCISLCMNCLEGLFEEYKIRFEDQELALIAICAVADVPFVRNLYQSVNEKSNPFQLGNYMRTLNTKQYKNRTFINSILEGEIYSTEDNDSGIVESKIIWTPEDSENRDQVVRLLGYDPFNGYQVSDRKYLFGELLNYLDDDELLDDTYKLSQIIQLVNNNNQIRKYDIAISQMNAMTQTEQINAFVRMKQALVTSNDKIAKENRISVRNREGNAGGKGTITGFMREMRDRNLSEIATNYYNQLRSPSSMWAAEVSARALKENCFFDENDIDDMLYKQREMIQDMQFKLSDLEEENRLLKIENANSSEELEDKREILPKLQEELDLIREENETLKEEVENYKDKLRIKEIQEQIDNESDDDEGDE